MIKLKTKPHISSASLYLTSSTYDTCLGYNVATQKTRNHGIDRRVSPSDLKRGLSDGILDTVPVNSQRDCLVSLNLYLVRLCDAHAVFQRLHKFHIYCLTFLSQILGFYQTLRHHAVPYRIRTSQPCVALAIGLFSLPYACFQRLLYLGFSSSKVASFLSAALCFLGSSLLTMLFYSTHTYFNITELI